MSVNLLCVAKNPYKPRSALQEIPPREKIASLSYHANSGIETHRSNNGPNQKKTHTKGETFYSKSNNTPNSPDSTGKL